MESDKTENLVELHGCASAYGVNDAVVRVSMETSLIRNETETGEGQTFIDIIESGWKAIPSPNYISVSEALAMLG